MSRNSYLLGTSYLLVLLPYRDGMRMLSKFSGQLKSFVRVQRPTTSRLSLTIAASSGSVISKTRPEDQLGELWSYKTVEHRKGSLNNVIDALSGMVEEKEPAVAAFPFFRDNTFCVFQLLSLNTSQCSLLIYCIVQLRHSIPGRRVDILLSLSLYF